MNPLKTFLAFALGFLITALIGPAVTHISAQGQSDTHVCVDSGGVLRMIPLDSTCPKGQLSFILKHAGDTDVDQDKPKETKTGDLSQIDKAILNSLDRRLKDLEGLNCVAPGKSRVVAPFELKDRNGARIFFVDHNAVGLFNSSGQAVARMIADRNGGLFVAQGEQNRAFFGISDTVTGLGFQEGNQLRVELGRNPEFGNYRVNFRSASGGIVAGMGESTENLGLAVIRDQSGNTRATLGIAQNGTGLIEILGRKTIAQLTEGDQHHGGKLWIGNASGVGMVEAGDAGTYGIVKAGPQGFEFIPTPGLALPGSVIVGKQ